MFRCGRAIVFLLATASAVAPVTCAAAQPDLDPDALAILKSIVASITGAQAFSFRVQISRDRQATNNQLVTYFREETVTVSRPDKMRIDVDGEHHDLEFFFDSGKATLFEPNAKLYVSESVPGTIDGMLQALDKKGVSFPTSDLLRSNPYDSLANGLKTAYVVGRVNIKDKTFIHLVFTEAAADWQLWVEPGDKPVPRAITIIYKTEPGMPRVVMDFSDWNLNARPDAATFAFVKPADAHEIQFLPLKAEK